MGNQKVVKLFLLFLVVFVSFLFIAAFAFLIASKHSPSQKYGENSVTRSEKYNYLTHNSKTRSQFGLSEFKCSGECICEDSEYSRRVTNVMSKGIYFFIAAMSSVVALDLSKKHFDRECISRYSDRCTAIKSSIDKCDNVHSLDIDDDDDDMYMEEIVGEGNFQGFKQFMCSGHCIPNDQLPTQRLRDAAQNIGCHSFDLRLKIEVPVRTVTDMPIVHKAAKFQFYQKLGIDCVFSSVGVGNKRNKIGIKDGLCVSGEFDTNPSVRCNEEDSFELDDEGWKKYDEWKKTGQQKK